jgi:hypothetical protein
MIPTILINGVSVPLIFLQGEMGDEGYDDILLPLYNGALALGKKPEDLPQEGTWGEVRKIMGDPNPRFRRPALLSPGKIALWGWNVADMTLCPPPEREGVRLAYYTWAGPYAVVFPREWGAGWEPHVFRIFDVEEWDEDSFILYSSPYIML